MMLFKVHYKVYLNISIPGLYLLLIKILYYGYTVSVIRTWCLKFLQNYELYKNIRRIK